MLQLQLYLLGKFVFLEQINEPVFRICELGLVDASTPRVEIRRNPQLALVASQWT
jgi:hypothetical protein